ncbi:glycosyl transferase [Clostridium felsineum]|uniref:macrolide family glycosyltransferase n=1 Tax=Clostridium felsineum TaxID=36839 RepID=UPI00214DC583|nr:macrolide family glycosyltransferase [Clostridium felsineum]MCR3760573.1 glycosyl transferase [Clostridium felsineum]
MGRALFISIAGHGHINPTIGIVRELMNRGEKVTYIAGEEFRNKVEEIGAEFIGHKNFNMANRVGGSLSLISDKVSLDTIMKSDFSNMILDVIETFKEIIEAVFNSKDRFDYIVYDSTFIFGVEMGRVLNIPAISSTTTFGINETILKKVVEKLSLSGLMGVLNNHSILDFARYLEESFHMKFPKTLGEVVRQGTINFVYTSRYFQPYNESFDESYKFIGPSIIDRKEAIEFNINNPENKKVIYISLGTIFNNSLEFYENCFKAFGDMNVQVIMSVGKKVDIKTFKDIPSNFEVFNYVPQLEVLKNTDIFITHGGMNSTNEGLYYDIPLILIPQFADQPIVAKRVAELGAGVVIEKSEVTPGKLKQAVENILYNDGFKTGSKKLGKSLRDAGGYKRGTDEILNLKKEGILL